MTQYKTTHTVGVTKQRPRTKPHTQWESQNNDPVQNATHSGSHKTMIQYKHHTQWESQNNDPVQTPHTVGVTKQ